MRFAAEFERGRLKKFPDGSKRLELTEEAMPFAPVTGGTNGQMTGGFMILELYYDRINTNYNNTKIITGTNYEDYN
jgi:hypothetical protein